MNWSDVTVLQFQEISRINEDDERKGIDKAFAKVQVLKDIQDISLSDQLKEIRKFSFLSTFPSESEDKEKTFFIFEQMTVMEFIHVESVFKNGIYTNLVDLLAIIYRIEPNEKYRFYDFEVRKELVKNMKITRVVHIINGIIKFKNDFFEKYKPLFEGSNIEPKVLNFGDAEKIEKLKALQKWAWDAIIWKFSGEDITKTEAIEDTSIIKVFNILSMKYEIDE